MFRSLVEPSESPTFFQRGRSLSTIAMPPVLLPVTPKEHGLRRKSHEDALKSWLGVPALDPSSPPPSRNLAQRVLTSLAFVARSIAAPVPRANWIHMLFTKRDVFEEAFSCK